MVTTYRLLYEGGTYISLIETKRRLVGDPVFIEYVDNDDRRSYKIGFTCRGEFSEYSGSKEKFCKTIRPLTRTELKQLNHEESVSLGSPSLNTV